MRHVPSNIRTMFNSFEVGVDDAVGMVVGERVAERSEDLDGGPEVDLLLQQHDGKVALRGGHDDAEAVVLPLVKFVEPGRPLVPEGLVVARLKHLDHVLAAAVLEPFAHVELPPPLILILHHLDHHVLVRAVATLVDGAVPVDGANHDRSPCRVLDDPKLVPTAEENEFVDRGADLRRLRLVGGLALPVLLVQQCLVMGEQHLDHARALNNVECVVAVLGTGRRGGVG